MTINSIYKAVVVICLLYISCKEFTRAQTSPISTITPIAAIATTKDTCDCGEYQIVLEIEDANIFDGDRYVGTLKFDSTQAFDKLMIKDNE